MWYQNTSKLLYSDYFQTLVLGLFLSMKFPTVYFFSTIHYFAEYLPAASLSFNYLIFRSSRPDVFCKYGVLRNFAKFTGKHLCQSLYFNKVAGLRKHLCQSLYFNKVAGSGTGVFL